MRLMKEIKKKKVRLGHREYWDVLDGISENSPLCIWSKTPGDGGALQVSDGGATRAERREGAPGRVWFHMKARAPHQGLDKVLVKWPHSC